MEAVLAQLDAQQLGDWIAWEEINGPLGSARLSLEFAYLRSVLLNVNIVKARDRVEWGEMMMFASPWAQEASSRGAGLNDTESILAFFLAWAGAEDPRRPPPIPAPV